MKHITGILALLLSFSLLAACGGQEIPADGTVTPADPAIPEGGVARCRIVDGAGEGSLLLAEEKGSIMRLGTKAENFTVFIDGKEAAEADLRDGMLVDVHFSGMVQESYPGGYDQVTALEGYTEGLDDRCGLYLQVLEDLWNVDPGLNADITELGVDLSGLTDLTESEKDAVAWRFGELHGLFPVQGTFEELCEQGYIDRENLYWKDGCLFSITTDTEAVWNLPMLVPGKEPTTLTAFDAQKWRSGLGAYFFCDCSAQMAQNGTWRYTVGSEAIS